MKILAFASGFRLPPPKLKRKNITWILILYSLPCKPSITFHGLSVKTFIECPLWKVSCCPSEKRQRKKRVFLLFFTISKSSILLSVSHFLQFTHPGAFLQLLEQHLPLVFCPSPHSPGFPKNYSYHLQIVQFIISYTLSAPKNGQKRGSELKSRKPLICQELW